MMPGIEVILGIKTSVGWSFVLSSLPDFMIR